MKQLSVTFYGFQPPTQAIIEGVISQSKLKDVTVCKKDDCIIEKMCQHPEKIFFIAISHLETLDADSRKKISKSRKAVLIVWLDEVTKQAYAKAAKYHPQLILDSSFRDFQMAHLINALVIPYLPTVAAEHDIQTFSTPHEEKFLAIAETSGEAIIICREDGKIDFWNKAAEKIFGFTAEETYNKSIDELINPNYNTESFYPIVQIDVLKKSGYKGKIVETRAHTRMGKEIQIEASLSSVQIAGKSALVCIIRNVSEKFRIMRQIWKANHFLDVIVDNANVMISFTKLNNQVSLWNKAAEIITGYTKQEVIGSKNILELLFPDSTYRLAVSEEIRQSLNCENGEAMTLNILTRSGENKTISLNAKPIRSEQGNVQGYITVAYDVTNRTLKEQEVKARLQEKEILIKEIHHRVKNNLQVMTSLINLQTGFIENPFTTLILRETQNRLRTMALIQETLYHSQNYTRLNFKTFLKNYFNEVERSFSDLNVEFIINFDDIYFDIDSSMTLGLLTNEMTTNAMKHAFQNHKHPCIQVDILQTIQNRIFYIFSDNGAGLPKGIDFKNPETLGLQLIHILASQLDGDIDMENKKGTKYSLRIDSGKIVLPAN